MIGLGDRLDALLSHRVRPLAGTLIGLAGVAVVVIAFALVHDSSARVVEALVLVVPVVAAAVIGGQRAATAVAFVATAAFTLMVPPFGTLRIELTQDVVALVVFLAVALVVGAVVARRVEVLGDLEQQREVLLRSVSHDFRTPLAIISAATSDLIESTDYDEATRRRLNGLVLGEAERLDRLVSNLLDLSRMRSGGLTPDLQAVDVAELVTYSTERLRRVLDTVDLHVSIPDDTPSIQADFTQADQVLTNLLENAVRHSPAGGIVRLDVVPTPRTVRITVSDDGPGIPPELVDELFEPFRSGQIPGASGVGLAICRAVVEAHGGSIRVGSPTTGAELIVELPISRRVDA